MKRYIKINSNGEIIDLFFEIWKDRFDGTEIFHDEVEGMDIYINGKCISDDIGNPLFKVVDGKVIEIDSGVYADSLYDYKLNQVIEQRKAAYMAESDGLFFDYQRGEATKEDWEAKIKEIKKRYPKPEKLK